MNMKEAIKALQAQQLSVIKRLRKRGVSVIKIAKEVNLSRQRVYKILERIEK